MVDAQGVAPGGPLRSPRRGALLGGALLAIVALGGCTTAGLRLMQDPLATVDQSLADGHYNRAWEIVTRMPASSPHYQAARARQAEVEQAVTRFEQARLREVNQLANAGDWLAAFALLEESRRQWSHGDVFVETRQRLHERQTAALLRLQAELLASEAEWLAEQRTRRRDLARFDDRSASRRARDLERRQQQLADELQELGEHFAAAEDWPRAHTLLGAVRRLAPERSLPELERASREVAGAQRRARDAQAARIQQQARDKIERYRHSRKLDDLMAARVFVERQQLALEEERRTLDVLTEERLEQDLREGDSRYARGDYQGAYDIWKSVLPLAPNNVALNGRLERTRRVLQTLRQLEAGTSR